ncbi:MAG: response regulator transcription factor [Opitutus sp.]
MRRPRELAALSVDEGTGEPKLPAATAEMIVVVDDESVMRSVIARLLTGAGYRVAEAGDGVSALDLIGRERPALLLLDVNMPGMSGLLALNILRERGFDFPVLMISGQAEVEHRLAGLEMGADDYMAKPFDARELLARVAALLRRRRAPANEQPRKLTRGDVVIDLDRKVAERAGRQFPLTITEFAILDILARNVGKPVSKQTLLTQVWGYSTTSKTRTVETHIWRLRKKLGDERGDSGWIENRHSLGYVLTQANAVIPETVSSPPSHSATVRVASRRFVQVS